MVSVITDANLISRQDVVIQASHSDEVFQLNGDGAPLNGHEDFNGIPMKETNFSSTDYSEKGEEKEDTKSLLARSEGRNSQTSSTKGSWCSRLEYVCQCCMWKYHDQPDDDDGCCKKCSWYLMCPPHGRIAKLVCILVLAFLTWAVPWSIVPDEALPGGNLFGIIILLLSCLAAGWLISHIPLPGIPPLPPLLGMLIMGFVLRNVPYIDVAKYIEPKWSSSLRTIALTVILTRAGIGLDGKALFKLKWVLLGFAVSTSIVECVVVAAFSTIMIGFPWDWGFVIGFVLCAVSPAVVVPSLLYLQDKGFGVEGGIPTFLIAGAALNDVIGITGFNVVLGMIFSDGDLVEKIIHGPLELVFGIGGGVILGIFLWYFPPANLKGRNGYRTGLLLGLALFCGFGSKVVHYAGAGALATLVMSFVAGVKWGKEKKPVAKTFANLWVIFQPLLFGLIGASVKIESLKPETVGMGTALIFTGLAFRSVTAFLAVYWTAFNMKEKVFMTVAWVPKATVQAAIGAVALDMATEKEASEEVIGYGTKVLTIAVLSILLTAPTGAAAIGLLGPKLLKRSPQDDEEKAAP
ncbi:sodium/hydrogen exchanger 9B2-like [Clavelina lepadiformis]|uniref:sodium/hydrogen exchanger 9B2-like n=1 Tax=Clavelina lepadiformis TaxID=159417 RepID=UPI00404295EC